MAEILQKNGSDFGPNDQVYCEAALHFYFNSSLNQGSVQEMLDLLNDAHFFRGTHTMARDETSHTATPGPNSPNDYLQYGVGHADDIYYLFKGVLGLKSLVRVDYHGSAPRTSAACSSSADISRL